jgi:hypothetical protein
LVLQTTPWGLPCCVRFPCVHAVATTPAQRLGASSARFPSRISLPRYGSQVGLHIVLFEACSAFTCVTACTLALPPYFVARLTEGFNRFVTSTVAPVASGWSRRRVGLAPTGKAPPFHGARQERTLRQPRVCPRACSWEKMGSVRISTDQGAKRMKTVIIVISFGLLCQRQSKSDPPSIVIAKVNVDHPPGPVLHSFGAKGVSP